MRTVLFAVVALLLPPLSRAQTSVQTQPYRAPAFVDPVPSVGRGVAAEPKRIWRLVWSDDFAGEDGSAPEPAKWTMETGTGDGGWGNAELEYYTDRRENVRVQGGELVITALREHFSGPGGEHGEFTSARLKTEKKFDQAYGRFEARIKIPRGQGMWPAFWLLGANHREVGWPRCGEIDIMENIGKEPNLIHGSIHGPGYSGSEGISAPYEIGAAYAMPDQAPYADDFHVFALEWEPGTVRFLVDGALYATRTPKDLPPGGEWVFDHPFFLILNLAVGGGWPGAPDATTRFPAEMRVDYVRAYEAR